MLSKLLGKLTYANVTATIALFVALSAGAYAAVNLPKDSVKSKHIKDGQVKAGDLKGSLFGNLDEAQLGVGEGFTEGDPFVHEVPGYLRTEVFCDDNDTPGIANDDFVQARFTNLLGGTAYATGVGLEHSSATNDLGTGFPSFKNIGANQLFSPSTKNDRIHGSYSIALPDGSKGVYVEVFAVEDSTSAECYAQVHAFPSD